jgi:hypothetical protein
MRLRSILRSARAGMGGMLAPVRAVKVSPRGRPHHNRTYTPDRGKESIYGTLGDLCSEKEVQKKVSQKLVLTKLEKLM